MKNEETRWYWLWFFTSGMWLITFCVNLLDGRMFDWVLVMQFFNILISLAAGIVNRQRYKKKNEENGRNRS